MSEKGQLYFGGKIYTVDDSRPTAEAVAVKNGLIVAVGSESDCRSALGPQFEPVDLRGRALLPGFIDTHLHPVMMVYFNMNADLRDVKSIRDLQNKMGDLARSTAPGAWVVGLNFDEQSLDEPRFLTRRELDVAGSEHPLIIIKHDGHTVLANTKAIEAAGISAATKNPDGGVIDREHDGYPAGPFRETASKLILGAMPMPEIDSFVAGAKGAFRKMIAHGITSAGVVLQTGEEGPAGASGAFEVLAMQLLLEHVPFNMYGLLIAREIEKFDAARKTGLHRQALGGHRIGGYKIFAADGTFGSCTAYMREPFSDQPDKRGFLVIEQEEIYRRMEIAHKAGLQIAIHAIGDAANRVCIDLYDRLLKKYPRENHRHRLEHASILDAAMIADIARLGLVISSQPMFIHSEKHWLHKRLGADRAKWTYPFRAILDGGIKLAGASDAPVESTDVLHAIQCCVTREGFEPQQGISVAEAIRMFTIDAAYAQFEETVKGSISVGKRADMVILSDNPVSVPPEEIRDIRVEQTIVGGVWRI